ncbi:MAG: hypothetical protein D6722_18545 [Bacteroidetes bacterium]|nr:MAG: hypothetical protein D6722_18545 [Bacteroidota bacterium]
MSGACSPFLPEDFEKGKQNHKTYNTLKFNKLSLATNLEPGTSHSQAGKEIGKVADFSVKTGKYLSTQTIIPITYYLASE